jgi:hypothetical protein
MILVKEKKAQIMILDVFLFLIIVILIISIQADIIYSYKENLLFNEEKVNNLKKEYLIENELLGCDLLGYLDKNTKKCYKNKIQIKNKDKIPEYLCKIKINEKEIINLNKNIMISYKRGVVYNNQFSVLEVSFCEE